MAHEQANKVVRDEITTTRTVVTVGPVAKEALGTFGWFIAVRNRDRSPDRDEKRYGKCVICGHSFADEDQVHMVFNVVRNGKTVGNRLCCGRCAEEHGTFPAT